LKILLLSYTDSGGGAALAVFRLFNALRKHGVDVYLGVLDKKSSDTSILALEKKKAHGSCIIIRLFKKFQTKTISYLKKKSGLEFKTSNPIFHSENRKTLIDIDYINNSDYDLLHFHWINHDMISIEDIKKIKKPIVWTMHDSWVFCGAEHHPNILENDNRFIFGYFRENKPKTTIGIDICRKTWERKVTAWKNCHFNFISPSNYEKDELQKSALFHSTTCSVIPNIVPNTIFRSLDKKTLQNIYRIPAHKKIIGFGAATKLTNKKSLKGEHFLFSTLQMIDKPTDYYLIIIGDADNSFINNIRIPVFGTGFISNPYILTTLYNLCDVFVCPSIIEVLPYTSLESLFCGVPVTAFRTGGISDVVEHKKTGYLAEPFDTKDLYRGIEYCIENHESLSKNSLAKAKNEFDNNKITEQHIEFYKKVCEQQEDDKRGKDLDIRSC
jgi:glycosyltransferase involved in cell wall biosynthesis